MDLILLRVSHSTQNGSLELKPNLLQKGRGYQCLALLSVINSREAVPYGFVWSQFPRTWYTRSMKYVLYADGGSRGNAGKAGAGAVTFDSLGKRVAEVSDYLGETTNNVAEYEAILRGLRKLLEEFPAGHFKQAEVTVRMDSELVIKQMRGEY